MDPALPLSGIRIVSFEQFGAGPYGTSFLAAFGAEVLKVEAGEGDHARKMGPPECRLDDDSFYHQCLNLGKKSIAIDLRKAEDRAFFEDLVRTADAVLNNLRGPVAAKLGLEYEALKTVNPAIVCGHISAYGRKNSRAARPGYDFLMQAESGLMSMTGEPGGIPTRIGASMIDHMAGVMLAYGVTAALHGARRTGKGCDVDVSLFEVAVHQLAYQGSWYLNAGVETLPQPRSAHPSNTPVQLFRTADGWMYVAAMTDKFWAILCDLLDRPDLLADTDFATVDSRLEHRDRLTDILDAAFSTRSTDDWVELIGEQIPAAPVYGVGKALDNPFLVGEAEMVQDVPHPQRPDMRMLANPLRIDGRRLPAAAAPPRAAHTEEIRRELAAKKAL